MRTELRGHPFDEQEHMLAPESEAGPLVAPPRFDSLVQSQREHAPEGPPKTRRKAPAPPVTRAPPPPTTSEQETTPEPEKDAKPPAQRETKRMPTRPGQYGRKRPPQNERAATRLDQGAKAVGMIKAGVDRAATTFARRKGAQEKGAPKPPPYDHAAAAGVLEHTRGLLVHDAAAARASFQPVPERLVPSAGETVAMAAERIDKKVEPPHVESTRDLATGLRDGDEAMLTRLLERGGELSTATLETVKGLAQNQQANVYQANYLGMAPLVYKVSAQQDLLDEGEDPTVKEHQVMRELGGRENVLQAGGKTIERRGFIMRLAQKGDLAGVGKALQDLPVAERIEVWRHLMRGGMKGLARVHSTGRSHGDVKNENFLLGNDLEAQLMDFGTTEKESQSTRSGTDKYMAPEVPHTQKAKRPSDVWSMGESLLLGVFGMNSVDFARGGERPTDKTRFGEETGKRALLADGKWLDHVKAQVEGVPDGKVFIDFIKKVMTLKPERRLTAKQALKHEFLALKEGTQNRGKEQLRARLG